MTENNEAAQPARRRRIQPCSRCGAPPARFLQARKRRRFYCGTCEPTHLGGGRTLEWLPGCEPQAEPQPEPTLAQDAVAIADAHGPQEAVRQLRELHRLRARVAELELELAAEHANLRHALVEVERVSEELARARAEAVNWRELAEELTAPTPAG